jgi:hypothetical protein
MPDQAGNVGYAYSRVGPGGKFRSANIHGICTMINSGDPDVGVACRRQQFQ